MTSPNPEPTPPPHTFETRKQNTFTLAGIDHMKAARYDFIVGWLRQVTTNADDMTIDEINQMLGTAKREYPIDGSH